VIDGIPVLQQGLSTGEMATELGEKYGWSVEQEARVRVFLTRHREDIQGLQQWVERSLAQGAQILGWVILIPVLAIFFLRDGDQIADATIRVAFPESQQRQARLVVDHLHAMLASFVRAQILLCLLSFLFYAVVLFLLGFPHVIALSILGGVLEFIPVMGWISTAAVIIGIGLLNHLHWILMAVLLLTWRVAQDYFNLPRIMGHRLELHPLAAMLAVLVGAEVGGIIGIYLSVPVVASIHIIWQLRRGSGQVRQLAPTPGPIEQEVATEIPSSLVETTRD
jgi:predicted PurR-regulated permease PerM